MEEAAASETAGDWFLDGLLADGGPFLGIPLLSLGVSVLGQSQGNSDDLKDRYSLVTQLCSEEKGCCAVILS